MASRKKKPRGKRVVFAGPRPEGSGPKGEKLDLVRESVLDLVRMGLRGDRAMLAAGVTKRTISDWRARAAGGAAGGDPKYVSFFEAIDQADAEGEARDVITTAKAATPTRRGIYCGKCGSAVEVDVADIEGTQRVMSSAATHAMDRLGRRYPNRWSPTTREMVASELEQFLDMAAEKLGEEQYNALCDAYTAKYGPMADGESG